MELEGIWSSSQVIFKLCFQELLGLKKHLKNPSESEDYGALGPCFVFHLSSTPFYLFYKFYIFFGEFFLRMFGLKERERTKV